MRNRWRVVLAVALVMVGWAGWSYGRALTGPGNDSIAIRSTEWLKEHNLAWAVNDVERFWYSHHPPPKGGTPSGALRSQFDGGATAPGSTSPPGAGASVGSSSPGPSGASIGGRHLPAPAAIAPIVDTPLAGEGQWRPLGTPVNGIPGMYAAFLRPDAVHTSLVTAVAWMDPTLVKAVGYAGATEPGGGPWQNQAPIPVTLRPSLEAAFNSGFKIRDSLGGYYADGKTVRTMRDGAATLAIRSDGTPTVGMWGRDVRLGPDVAFARQNLSLIVDNGRPAAGISSDNTTKWGATLGNVVLVWRSGVGVTANGALVYAGGSGLSAASLADVLVRAGAVRAMELDINSAWVDFFTYGPPAPGQPSTDVTVTKLLPDMRPSTSNYLTSSSRDFIAIFRRA